MLAEYLSYWGVRKAPFSLSPDPEMLYLGPHHSEALLRLKYGVLSEKGGVLLISENAGDGKTSLLRRLVAELEPEHPSGLRTAFVDHPTLTVNQMIAEIARQLGVSRVRKEKVDNLNALRVTLSELHRAGARALVIVDEGQMLAHRPDLLQELRILLNFCVSDSFLVSFVLAGQRPLEAAVRQMPEFWQRLPVRFFLRNLDQRGTGELVRHRMRLAGQQREVFTETALEGIHRHSQGCPRVICSIADLALLVGFSLRSTRVDFGEVAQAASDTTRSGELSHYLSFTRSASAQRGRSRRCSRCGRFLKAQQTCASCRASGWTEAAPAVPAAPAAGVVDTCPACGEAPRGGSNRCVCGLLLYAACGRCQLRNRVDEPGCRGCAFPLLARAALASHEFEMGLRRLGWGPPSASLARRFPELQGEGRVFVACVAPRLLWGGRSRLDAGDGLIEGSFFITERGLVVIGRGRSRSIPFREIRALTIAPGEANGGASRAGLRIRVDAEELRLSFPVAKQEPLSVATLISHFVANRKHPRPC
jgi:type II secretory pathway predicted ATPase ExeA